MAIEYIINPFTGKFDGVDDTSADDLRYLKLDQSSPQATIGTFTFPKVNIGTGSFVSSNLLQVNGDFSLSSGRVRGKYGTNTELYVTDDASSSPLYDYGVMFVRSNSSTKSAFISSAPSTLGGSIPFWLISDSTSTYGLNTRFHHLAYSSWLDIEFDHASGNVCLDAKDGGKNLILGAEDSAVVHSGVTRVGVGQDLASISTLPHKFTIRYATTEQQLGIQHTANIGLGIGMDSTGLATFRTYAGGGMGQSYLFQGNNADRYRLNLLNTEGASHSSTLTWEYNDEYGLHSDWEMGNDYFQNATNTFYLWNSVRGKAIWFADASGRMSFGHTLPTEIYEFGSNTGGNFGTVYGISGPDLWSGYSNYLAGDVIVYRIYLYDRDTFQVSAAYVEKTWTVPTDNYVDEMYGFTDMSATYDVVITRTVNGVDLNDYQVFSITSTFYMFFMYDFGNYNGEWMPNFSGTFNGEQIDGSMKINGTLTITGGIKAYSPGSAFELHYDTTKYGTIGSNSFGDLIFDSQRYLTFQKGSTFTSTLTASSTFTANATSNLNGDITIANAKNIIFNTGIGTKIGTATNQKLGFFNATPIVQVGATIDLGVVLSNLGFRAAGTAYPITTSGAATLTGGAIIKAPAVASTAETVLTCTTTDAPASDYFAIFNGTTTNSQFLPTFYGKQNSNNAAPSLGFIGDVAGLDTGSVPALEFQARAGLGATATRDILRVRNYATEYLRISRLGNILINTTGGNRRVEINTGAATDGIRLTYNDSNGDATVYSELLVDSTGTLTLSSTANIFTFANDAANADLIFNFSGTSSSGVLKWMEDEDYFEFTDTIVMDLDTFWIGDGSGIPYGSCYGNEIGWTQAATQSTWYNISDADMTDGELNLVTHDGSGKLTVTKAGRYKIDYSASVFCSANNAHIEMGIEISDSGTANVAGRTSWYPQNANAEGIINGTAILDLAAGATVEISVLTETAGTPTLGVNHLNFNVTMVGGT